jgi:hypothetical protein
MSIWMWEDFANFYTLIYFIITLFKHAIDTFSKWQLHILDSWDVYKKEKAIPLIGLKCTLLSFRRLGPKIQQQS